MTASNMLCGDCGGLIVTGQRKKSVDQNEARNPGLQVAGAGTFSKANVFVYHADRGTSIDGSGRSCWSKADGRS